MKKNILTLVFVICFVIFCVLVRLNDVLDIDVIVYDFICNYLKNPFVTWIMKVITMFGDVFCVVIVCLVSCIFIFRYNRRLSLIIPLNIIIITIINNLIKVMIKRPRPSFERLISVSGYSFPSGHAMVSLVFYGFYIYLVCRFVMNRSLRRWLIGLLSLLIVLIGLSRIYLGVHYFSDVVCGYMLSFIYLVFVTRVMDKYVLGK